MGALSGYEWLWSGRTWVIDHFGEMDYGWLCMERWSNMGYDLMGFSGYGWLWKDTGYDWLTQIMGGYGMPFGPFGMADLAPNQFKPVELVWGQMGHIPMMQSKEGPLGHWSNQSPTLIGRPSLFDSRVLFLLFYLCWGAFRCFKSLVELF